MSALTAPVRVSEAPAGRRSTIRRRRDARLVGGAALLALAVVLGIVVVERADRTAPVWAAARDLPSGTVLTADDVVAVPARLDAASAAYLTATAAAPVGARVGRAVGAGELLPAAAVGPADAVDRRLITVPVEQFHAPAGLARGDVVDVYLTPRAEAGSSGPATLVAPAALVHEVEEEGGRFGASARSVGVVLALDPTLVPRVVSGVRKGSVDLVRVPAPR